MITKRQLEVMLAFEQAETERSPPPTYIELAKVLKVKSTATVREHLETLEKKLMLERSEHASRNWRLTVRGHHHLRLRKEVKEAPLG